MRVKLFSHGADPDGLGCVILAKLIFSNVDFTLCKDPQELNEVLQQFILSDEYQNYDKIYVTDLCPADQILQTIVEKQISCFEIYDHHKTSREKLSCDYSFVTSMDTFCGVSCSAMSLFYHHLKSLYSFSNSSYIDTFVEYTRLHDTYEWKEKNLVDAFQLQTLFQFLGCYGYFYHFYFKCLHSSYFSYDKEELKWIEMQEKKNHITLNCMMKHLVFKKEDNISYASVIGSYEYRNLMANKLQDEFHDIDIFMILAYDNESVSLRSLKDKPVDGLAREYDGGGHERAASIPLTSENELKLIKRFLI